MFFRCLTVTACQARNTGIPTEIPGVDQTVRSWGAKAGWLDDVDGERDHLTYWPPPASSRHVGNRCAVTFRFTIFGSLQMPGICLNLPMLKMCQVHRIRKHCDRNFRGERSLGWTHLKLAIETDSFEAEFPQSQSVAFQVSQLCASCWLKRKSKSWHRTVAGGSPRPARGAWMSQLSDLAVPTHHFLQQGRDTIGYHQMLRLFISYS